MQLPELGRKDLACSIIYDKSRACAEPMLTEKVSVENLDVGMYISRLDRPWLESPFLLQGFMIKDEEDLAQLRQYCEFVYVDLEQSTTSQWRPDSVSPTGAQPSRDASPAASKPSIERHDRVSVEKEIEFARNARASLKEAVGSLMDAVREGKKPNVAQLRDSVAEMESSIIRNPDAFMLLRSLQERDTYTYSHCIDSSVLAIAFARHLGLPKDQISDVGLGALLADVGKVRILPTLLTAARRLSGTELEQVRMHVTHSVDIMEELPGMSERIVSVASTHHERFDGSGYPDPSKRS